jgi:hypothetical protein
VLEGDKTLRDDQLPVIDDEGSGEGDDDSDAWGDPMEVASTSRNPKLKIGSTTKKKKKTKNILSFILFFLIFFFLSGDRVRYIGPSPSSVPLRILRGGLYAPSSSRGEHQGPYGGSKGNILFFVVLLFFVLLLFFSFIRS